jgi:hypothetical protein
MESMLAARLDKLTEKQLHIDRLFKDIEDTHKVNTERSLRANPPSPVSYPDGGSSVVTASAGRQHPPEVVTVPVSSQVTPVISPKIESSFKEPPPAKLLNGALTCSANATIKVDRAAAEAAGVYWYDRAAPRCALTDSSHKMEPGCSGVGNERVKAKQRQILVVGVQRSGTHFTWEMFNRYILRVHNINHK